MSFPYKILAMLIVQIGLLMFVYYKGSQATQAKWDAAELMQKENEIKLIHQNEQKNIEIAKKQSEINLKVAKNAKNRLELLDKIGSATRNSNSIGDRLCNPKHSTCSSPMPSDSTSNGRNDEKLTGNRQLSNEFEEKLWEEAKRADELVEQLREAQDWIRQNNFYDSLN